jgi:hypothetical protein
MAKNLGKLLGRLGRRDAKQAGPPDGPLAVDPSARDDAPLELPVLMPAVIFRQLIFDGTEVTPVWARPRPAPESEPATTTVGASNEPKPAKRARRPKPDGPSGASRPKTRRATRKDDGALDG